MDDEALRAKYDEQKKRRELLLKQLYIKQIVEQPTTHLWDMTIIAKELRLEVPFSRIEIQQHYRYFVGEGFIEHAIPEPPNKLNNASFTVVRGPFFPDTRLTHEGILEVEKQLDAEKVAGNEKEKSNIGLPPNPPGAPPILAYDQAFKKLSEGMDEDKAFKLVCEARGWDKTDRYDRAAFKAAMNRRRNKTK